MDKGEQSNLPFVSDFPFVPALHLPSPQHSRAGLCTSHFDHFPLQPAMNGKLRSLSGFIPDELLLEVFISCLEPDDIGCTVPSTYSAPLVLTWVCRHWRRICLATPRLWAGINLFDQPPAPTSFPAFASTSMGASMDGSSRRFGTSMRMHNNTPAIAKTYITKRANLLHLLDLWIARSKGFPISIRFSYTDMWESERGRPMLFLPGADESAEYERDMAQLVDKLLTCKHRWRALDMSVLDFSVIEPLLEAISVAPATPKLEHLSVATQYLGIFGQVRSHDFALSPRLKTVKILSPLIVPSAGGAAFQHLSELELKFCSSMSGCLQWIDTAPNLEILKVRLFTAEAQTLEGETRIRSLPRLKVLDVTAFSNDSDPGPLLSILRTPDLRELKVDASDLIESRGWTCVQDLLRCSQSSLESLTLLGTPMTTEEIINCLRFIPDATYLDLGAIHDEVLRALTFFPQMRGVRPEIAQLLGDGIPLCPKLKTLVISDIEECTIDALVKMITSRHHKTAPLLRHGQEGSELFIEEGPERNELGRDTEVIPSLASVSEVQDDCEPYKTLEEIYIGYDPEFTLLSHPEITNCMDAGLYVEATLPEGFEILNEDNTFIEVEEAFLGTIL